MKKKVILITLLFAAIFSVSEAQIRFGSQNRSNTSNSLNLSYSNPQEYVIAAIEVEGAEFLDNNALISISGLKVGDKIRIPGDNITSAIKRLWKQGLIGDIQIYANKVEGNNIFLTISLAERPRLSKFNFNGLTKNQESEIREQINLIRGRVLTDAIVKNTELNIVKYFAEKGFLNANVNTKIRRDTLVKNSVQLDVTVNKNQKVKIRNINIEGDDNFSNAKLKRKLKNTGERVRFNIASDLLAKGFYLLKPKHTKEFVTSKVEVSKKSLKQYINDHVKFNIFKSNKFIQNKYEEDKEALIAYYNSKGYRDAEIIQDTVYSVDSRSMDINLKVSPGQKYFFRNIQWTGNFVHDDDILDRILAINKGDVYNLELIDKKLNFNPNGPDISSLYMDNGYLFFNVNPVEVKIEGDSVDVEMRIYEGAQATINKVYLTGNDRTNDHVVMREIRTLPGEKFSRAELIRTQRELAQLGYFDPEQVSPTPLPNPADQTVDIQWSLVERPSDQIELSGGWGGSFGFVGTLGLVFNNFSIKNIPHFDKWRPLPVGDGQKLALRLQANGRRFQSY